MLVTLLPQFLLNLFRSGSYRRLVGGMFFLGLAVRLNGCSEAQTLPAIGDMVARPTAVAYDPTAKLFYVLNSNLNQHYSTGSLQAINHQGQLEHSEPLPRLGRTLVLAGDFLLLTFDRESPLHQDQALPKSQVALYKIDRQSSRPLSLTLQKSWPQDDCSPLSATMLPAQSPTAEATLYPYFAVSCLNGKMLVGKINESEPKASTLQTVRQFPNNVRAALHLDRSRNLLYAFSTAVGGSYLDDMVATDSGGWDPTQGSLGKFVKGTPNEVPDELENTWAKYTQLQEVGSHLQFWVYDLAAASQAGFPWKDYRDYNKTEMRWLYFTMKNGASDIPTVEANQHYYRSNFWRAQPHPVDPDRFYLSHRGLDHPNRSQDSNNIVEVTVTGSRDQITNPTAVATDKVFEFVRVFGFKDQRNTSYYLNDFSVLAPESGPETLVISSFKDLAYFDTDHYAIVAATVGETPTPWSEASISESADKSYFQLAASPPDPTTGEIFLATCSFYGNSIIVFTVKPGENLNMVKTFP